MIDTQKIKSKILDLAICGQLTDRVEGEETGEEVISQIRKEREESAVKTKSRSHAAVPLNIAENNPPFELPFGWDWVSLETIGADVPNAFADGPFGSNLKKEHYTSEKQVRIIQLSNVGIDGWKDSNEKYTTYEHLATIQRSEVKAGNIVIAKMMPAGRAIIVPHNVADAFVLSSDCVKFVPYPLLNAQYLCYAINSKWFHDQVLQDVHGIGRERTSLSNLKSYYLPIPSLGEQARIVAVMNKVSHILNDIDLLQSQYADNLIVLKSKLIDAAIQGKLTEQLPEDGTAEELYQQILEEKQALIREGKIKKEKPLPEIKEDEIPFEIPVNWKWVRWGDLSESIQYGYNAPAKDSGRIKMLRISDIQNGRVLWDSVPYCEISEKDIPTYLLSANDILFARTGGTVGKSYLVKNVPENTIYAGYLIRTRYSANLCPEYMKHFMESKLYWKQLQYGTTATAQPNCNGKTLSRMIIPLPPLAEQRRIVARLDQALAMIEV